MVAAAERGSRGQALPIIRIEEGLRLAGAPLVLGELTATVVVERDHQGVRELLKTVGTRQAEGLTSETLKEQQEISAFRRLYREIGQDPSRYRPSSEALIRRVILGKGLYNVNNVVDAGNVLSMETFMPYGIYDLDRIQGEISFRIGGPGETFQGIRKGMINAANLPVFVDDLGPFGTPTSDSERTMIRHDTNRVLMVVMSCTGNRFRMDRVLARATELLQEYAQAQDFQTDIIS